jgi:hypothetical protein
VIIFSKILLSKILESCVGANHAAFCTEGVGVRAKTAIRPSRTKGLDQRLDLRRSHNVFHGQRRLGQISIDTRPTGQTHISLGMSFDAEDSFFFIGFHVQPTGHT